MVIYEIDLLASQDENMGTRTRTVFHKMNDHNPVELKKEMVLVLSRIYQLIRIANPTILDLNSAEFTMLISW